MQAVPQTRFKGKAETLAALAGALKSAKVLPQVCIQPQKWRANVSTVLADIAKQPWSPGKLIVRSNARQEDHATQSLAGRFLSIGGVTGTSQLKAAIDEVFASFGDTAASHDEVFVQPYLEDLTLTGVAFGCDPNTGAPYFVVNYEEDGDSAAITSGRSKAPKTLYFWKDHDAASAGSVEPVIEMLRELESYLGTDALDVEFGMSRSMGLCLFQARPLVVSQRKIDGHRHQTIMQSIARRIRDGSRPHPYLSGDKTVYGVMPDWNPAEIIGIRPRPLALSLYRALVTDQVWAYQRSNYGYRNLRSFPLMVSFHGLPYIDVRVSFNSFVPADIERGLADRLVNAYIQRLLAAPALHDKVEFEIVYSCYTLDLPRRLETLRDSGFSAEDIDTIQASLRKLTNNVIHGERGLWKEELARIETLAQRRRTILDADLDHAARIYWLLEDCKRWGTLPFAGLARAGFIAMQMLRSLVTIGILDVHQFDQFMAGTETVTSQMLRDYAEMSRPVFLEKYGHLRPGTYDILSPRYDEAPDLYLGSDRPTSSQSTHGEFRLSLGQMKDLTELLRSNRLEMDVVGLFDFMRSAVQGREYSKFVFTRSLSDAISLFTRFGAELGFTPEDLSFADIRALDDLAASSDDPRVSLARSIEHGRAYHNETCAITLPPLIATDSDVWAFEIPPTEPNFVTQLTAVGHVCTPECPRERLKGGIVFIQNADPGYDWIFTHGIQALVTAYGGVNSHMAIRAGESGIPAVIGVGEQLFAAWKKSARLRIDCSNRRVEML